MVEHSPQYPKVKGLSTPTAGTEIENGKMVKKVSAKIFASDNGAVFWTIPQYPKVEGLSTLMASTEIENGKKYEPICLPVTMAQW